MLGDGKHSAKRNLFCFREKGRVSKGTSLPSLASVSLTQEPSLVLGPLPKKYKAKGSILPRTTQ